MLPAEVGEISARRSTRLIGCSCTWLAIV
jgi:hypothetical protein